MYRNASNETEEEDRRKSSSSSEGEYHVETSEFQTPNFSGIAAWDPQGPASLQYMCLLPLSVMQMCSSPPEQSRHINKVKVSVKHRQQRLKDFKLGRTIGRNIFDEKRMQRAASENQYDLVNELLESGVDPCCCDNKQRSALHFAASQGNELIVKVLLDKGANPNSRDILGNTPMHLAAITGHVPVVTLLLKAGPFTRNLTLSLHIFMTENVCATRIFQDPGKSAKALKALTYGGTDVKSEDKNGRTPLSLAQARLKMLSTNTGCTSEHLKQEVNQISDMMKTYLRLVDLKHVSSADVDQLCSRLESSSTLQEVDQVSSLLASFTAFTLETDTHPG